MEIARVFFGLGTIAEDVDEDEEEAGEAAVAAARGGFGSRCLPVRHTQHLEQEKKESNVHTHTQFYRLLELLLFFHGMRFFNEMLRVLSVTCCIVFTYHTTVCPNTKGIKRIKEGRRGETDRQHTSVRQT